jgi:hypothetical protein
MQSCRGGVAMLPVALSWPMWAAFAADAWHGSACMVMHDASIIGACNASYANYICRNNRSEQHPYHACVGRCVAAVAVCWGVTMHAMYYNPLQQWACVV